MQLDLEFIRERLPVLRIPPPVVADFGCGTGRIARSLKGQGYRFLNVDLSQPMLLETRDLDSADCFPVRMNLVELDAIAQESIDLALCLFSSIGMIRLRENRIQFLRHVSRSLKTNSQLILHVHNRYQSVRDPGGMVWLAKSRLLSWLQKTQEFGDRVYVYRNLPKMFLHIYSQRELRSDLSKAGFENTQIFPIDQESRTLLKRPKWLTSLRAGGFFAVATKTKPDSASG